VPELQRPTGPPPRFASFREFYPYYLAEHSNRTSRRLHVIGTLLAVAIAAGALLASRWAWLLAVPLAGYLPAWVGHFFFEGNSPATFRHPLYSLRGDFSMLAEVIKPFGTKARVYVCGPTLLVEAVATALVQMALPIEQIRTERFGPTGV